MPLQMALKPDNEGCASEEVEPRREVDTRQCASKDIGPRKSGLGGPTSIEEGNKFQQGRWTSKGGGF